MDNIKYMLRIAFNGLSYYVVGHDGNIAIVGNMDDCKKYIDNETEEK